jgi:mortality factor 4-like protein 1
MRPFEKNFCCEIIQNAQRKGGQVSNKNQEETFHARPSIQLPIPDHVKAILVDDWENVTKNQQLVPLPSAHPVSEILDDYYNYEIPRRVEGSSHADILEEVVAGLKDYFEKCLGRVLLYRYEQNPTVC